MVRRLCLVVLLLLGPALAQTRSLEVASYPPGARVADQFGNYLGRSGEAFEIDPSLYTTRQLQLHLSLDGYEPTSYVLMLDNRNQTRIPPSGVITLQPLSRWLRLRDALRYQPWVPVTLGLAGLVMLGFQHQRRRLWERQEKLTAWQESAPGADSLILAELCGYRLVEILGQGGMATVYRAVPAETLEEQDAVAVKVLDRKLAQRTEFVNRFRREVNVSRWLSHPSVVRILDWGEERGYLYLVMELMTGVSLRDRLGQGPLPREEAARILDEVMEGVHYAHTQKVVHRDLKPENIMLTASGKAKVMDFGLARASDSDKLTQTGAALGTPAYMAPEQIRGDEPHPACDQYALGVTAYELLCGRLPFDGADPMQVLFSHMSDPPPPPGLSPALDAVLLKMLAKEPSQRYPDLQSAREALRKALKESETPGANMTESPGRTPT